MAASPPLTDTPTGRLLSAQQAAVYTGLPYSTLRDAALRGALPLVRIPGCRRLWFARADLDRALEVWREVRRD